MNYSEKQIKEIFAPHIINYIPNTYFKFNYKMSIVEKIVDFFILYIFTSANIVVAFIEISLIRTGKLDSKLIIVPVLHLLLLFFPYFYFTRFSPIKILINTREVILNIRKFFGGCNQVSFYLKDIQTLNKDILVLKGDGYKIRISGIFTSHSKKTLLAFKVGSKEKAEDVFQIISYILKPDM